MLVRAFVGVRTHCANATAAYHSNNLSVISHTRIPSLFANPQPSACARTQARARFEGSYAAHQQEEKEVLELSKELHALNKSKLLYHQKWIHSLEGIDQYNQTLYSLQNDMKGMKDAINNTVNQARTVTAAKPAEIKFEW